MSKKPVKSRKDLDDISDATSLNLRRVTRQFENLKRLYSFIEEGRQWQCNLKECIGRNFLLNTKLAQQYACIMFLLYAKFTLTSKKRMTRVSCENLENCAALIISCLNSEQEEFYTTIRFGLQFSCVTFLSYLYSYFLQNE